MIDEFLADEDLKTREKTLVQNRRKGGLRGLLKRLATGIGIAVLVIGVAAFFARGWLLAKGEQLLTDGLAKQGYFVGYEKARLHPVRGVVLKAVTLFETEERIRPVLSLSDIGVKIRWGRLIRERSLDGLTPEISIREGVLEAVSGDETVTISEVIADMEIAPGGIEVARANLHFEGLAIQSSGEIKFGGTEKKEKPEKEGDQAPEKGNAKKENNGLPDLAPLVKLKEWVAIEAEKVAPVLTVVFAVDPKGESPVSVEGTLKGEAFAWRTFPVDRLDAEFGYGGSTPSATLSRFELGYREGLLSAENLTFTPESGKAVIGRIVSRVDLLRMIEEFPIEGVSLQLPEAIEIVGSPELEIAGEVDSKEPAESSVTVRVNHSPGFRVKVGENQVGVTELRGELALRDRLLRTDGLEMAALGGSLKVSGELAVFEDPLNYQARVEMAQANLDELMALSGVESPVESVLEVSLDVSGSTELKSITAKGQIGLEGSDLVMNAPVEMGEGVIRVTGLTAELGGGQVGLSAAVDVTESTMPFAVDLRTGAVPVAAMARLGGRKAEEALEKVLRENGIELLGAPVITVKGSGLATEVKAADLTLEIEDETGIRLATEGKPPLAISGIRGTGTLRGGVFESSGVNARLLGGAVKISGKSAIFEEPITYQSRVEASEVAFEELMAFLGRQGVYPSKLGVAMDLSGGTELAAMAANGTVRLVGDGLELSTPLTLSKGVITAENLQANVGGGTIGLAVAANLVEKPLAFQADLQTRQVPIQKLLDVAGVEEEFSGNLTATFKGNGSTELAALNGTGTVRIDDGALYRVPLLGKVKDALAKRAPSFGREAPASLATTFAVENGVVATEDLTIVSDLTGVEAAGVFDMNRKWTKFTAQAKVVAGLASAATNPISKLLEVKGEGPVDDLKIGLSNLDPLTAIGTVKDTIGATKEGLKEAKDAVNGVRNLGEGGLRGLADQVIKAGTGGDSGKTDDDGDVDRKGTVERLKGLLPGRQPE